MINYTSRLLYIQYNERIFLLSISYRKRRNDIDSIGLNVYKYPIVTLAGKALLGPLSLGPYGKDKKIYIEGKREKATLYIYIGD